ncbi:RNA-binding protein 25-like isoform X2 [Galleria mellonella]|uniref:RNA-binding protein 25-like isoform X2 n=1 Tax=Galleria mellonella TaxID=7137 RepID=A0ABM3N389_GALME|nr:RNA-binding protein 25-like isoform X2 [Galleria mellonella]
MLSTGDLERLIIMKRREIEKEKMLLGLASRPVNTDVKEHATKNEEEQVNSTESVILSENGAKAEDKKERDNDTPLEQSIPPDLERYIRRYLGLPVMLKAGEYSPNNPLIRGERSSGDVLLGLGEYERRRNTLRKLRQQQYREYLDQQAKKKQEAKENAERERREREERERELEEREREREERQRESETLNRQQYNPDTRRASICYGTNDAYYSNKVDTGVQVDSITSPLSVAVQTEDHDFFHCISQLPLSPCKTRLTEAERELSPRTVDGRGGCGPGTAGWGRPGDSRRRSCGDYDTGGRLRREGGLLDADAIHRRNLQAEKEAAERRLFYQQELRNQILEQQRIKEERKTREKMLEQAEMRRLEEQLRMLRLAHEREIGKQHEINNTMKDEALDFTKKRSELQDEIDTEQKRLLRAVTQPVAAKRNVITSRSDTNPPKLQSYYARDKEKPFSTNIPDNSIFSPNYDVDTYLRRNLNFKDNVLKNRLDNVKNRGIDIESIGERKYNEKSRNFDKILERSKDTAKRNVTRPSDIEDSLPIPVLRHSPVTQSDKVENTNLSDAMKLVDDKWKVPAVQKNILKSLPNDEGKNISILTQLGSIRRQLQLEQLKLDRMNNDEF